MAATYETAVRNGTMAAARLHGQLGTRDLLEARGGCVDVFDAIRMVDLPLMLRPLKGLLGAYLAGPNAGMLVTSERPMAIQRFTAAHELGHHVLGHRPSLDDETVLRRMPGSPEPTGEFQEAEADAFAVAFMMPRWLILAHCARQAWQLEDLGRPEVIYQLALRLGASYEATCRTLERYRLVSARTARRLREVQPRRLKVDLLRDYRPPDYRGAVWLLTELDGGSRLEGSRNDLFVLRLAERGAAGYLWNFDQLAASGFAVLRDEREAIEEGAIGGANLRRITAACDRPVRGRIELAERRSWEQGPPAARIELDLDFTGPEEPGLSRAERRYLLQPV